MPSKKAEAMAATLNYVRIRASELAHLPCPRCRAGLDVCQPHDQRPHQLLATCGECGAWFRIELRAGDRRGVMVNLPEVAPLLRPDDGVIVAQGV